MLAAASEWSPVLAVENEWMWSHGESAVAQLRTASGPVIAKLIYSTKDWNRELRAHRHFVPALQSDASQILYCDTERRVLLMTVVPGQLVQATPGEHDPEIHRQAGDLVARLHGSVDAEIDENFSATLMGSFDRWASQAANLVDKADLRKAKAVAERVRGVGNVELVPTHGDNSPRNWMVDAGGHVRLIDFGHAELRPWCLDLYRLMQDRWLGRPDLQRSFLGGYGRSLDDNDSLLLGAYAAQASISTIVWATRHGDEAFALQGREQLRRALAG